MPKQPLFIVMFLEIEIGLNFPFLGIPTSTITHELKRMHLGTTILRPVEQTTAEAYRHAVPGGRPAEGGDACLYGGLRARQPVLGLQEQEGRL